MSTISRTVLAVLIATLCANAQTQMPLKDAFKGVFKVGAALNPGQFSERDTRGVPIIKTHFNTITPENVMKWGPIHPKPNEYAFEAADRCVEFGEKNGMFIVGHRPSGALQMAIRGRTTSPSVVERTTPCSSTARESRNRRSTRL